MFFLKSYVKIIATFPIQINAVNVIYINKKTEWVNVDVDTLYSG